MAGPFKRNTPSHDQFLRIEALRQAVAVVNEVDSSVVESAEAFYAFLASAPSGEGK